MIIEINQKELLKYTANSHYVKYLLTIFRRDREDIYKAIKSTISEQNRIILIKYACEQINCDPDRDW